MAEKREIKKKKMIKVFVSDTAASVCGEGGGELKNKTKRLPEQNSQRIPKFFHLLSVNCHLSVSFLTG